MYPTLVVLHQTFAALTLGALFLQSLTMVMALRLGDPAQEEGVRILQRRIHRFIHYPLLVITLSSGATLGWLGGYFTSAKWLHWKLVAVVLLIGLGMGVGKLLRRPRVAKPAALAVHIAVLLVGAVIVYFAALRPV